MDQLMTVQSNYGEDWIDDSPLEPIQNDYSISLEFLIKKKREPREDNCKRKLCYSYANDDGYGVSRQVTRRFHYCRRSSSFRARGKRFKKEDEMLIDGEELVEPHNSNINEDSEAMDEEVTESLLNQIQSDLKIN